MTDKSKPKIVIREVAELIPYVNNARTHSDEQVTKIASSIKEFGFINPIIIDAENGIIAGHGRLYAAKKLGLKEVPCIPAAHLSEQQKKAYILADNRLAELAGWDLELVKLELVDLDNTGFDYTLTGFDDLDLADLDDDVGGAGDGAAGGPGAAPKAHGSLQERFGVAPFSVLNAREGWWQNRKRQWLSLGIRSEIGRGDNLLKFSETAQLKKSKFGKCLETGIGEEFGREEQTGTSVFDPVLCELAYRWFCPPGGQVLDPFAGGSVRGIVAAKLGRAYWGGELRSEQVEANRAQWQQIGGETIGRAGPEDFMPTYTPIEGRGQYWFKRDDLFSVAGVQGGKVRSCWALAQGADGLVTAGSRASPQVNIVAHVANRLGIPCRVHTPEGELSPEVQEAQSLGAVVIQHPAGYNNVIIARAREDAKATGWREIPFGMECQEAIEQTKRQVANIPEGVKRIVMPVGSGMSLSGVLWGLRERGISLPVLGIQVGADPLKRLAKYAPPGWEGMVELVKSPIDYHDRAPVTEIEGLTLDPIYEAKCIPFLEPGDMLWVVGIRATEKPSEETAPCPTPVWHCGDSRSIDQTFEGQADMVFSCPPYADLEVYSDDPADLSTMDYKEFLAAYREIIAKACAKLRPDAFACFVVGDVRDRFGNYYNFVGDTVRAFQDAGLHYYNEGILVTAIGTLPIRAGRTFEASRKLGKTHQNVLVFVKGDGKKAAQAVGDVEFGIPLEETEQQ